MSAGAASRTAAAVLLLCLAGGSLAGARVGGITEYIQRGNLRVAFRGSIAPRRLPRVGKAPIAVSFSADIATTDNTTPPQLRSIKLEINRNGRLDMRGLPVCRLRRIQPASTAEAREACPTAIVGSGSFKSNVALPEQSPYPSTGRIVAFNGRYHGHPAILAHIYGTQPLPTSFTLPFEVRQRRQGTYGITLTAHLPQVAANWGYIRGVLLELRRRFRYRGRVHSYVSAGCPAAAGFPGATFDLARAAFGFEDGKVLRTTMTRNCSVRG